MDLLKSLVDYEKQGKSIKVGMVGAGQMGEGLACQMEMMHAMHTMVIADVIPGRASAVFESAKVPSNMVVETNDIATASQAIADGRRVATTNTALVAQTVGLDIVVEATGVPEVGARVALDAILNKRHVLQMNVETDATVGYILRNMANAAGIVYTLTAGDEPGTTMELWDFATTLGFEVICAGKGKNNTLDRSSNPENCAEMAKEQQMNPKMLASFRDGTKTMVEMTSFANAVGFVPDVRGMHGPEATPKTIADIFCPKEDGGVLSKTKVVDYGLGIAPGVFVVVTTDHPKIARDMEYLSMGKGPYWALYRPYHLTSLETPISILRAVLKGETTVATDIRPTTETVTYAKKDLKAGEAIDSLGGFCVYGMIEDAEIADQQNLLPIGLAPGSVLRKDIKAGEPVSYDDVELQKDSTLVHLRRLQDQRLGRRVR